MIREMTCPVQQSYQVWGSGFDPRSGSETHTFLNCLEILFKAFTRTLNSEFTFLLIFLVFLP